MSVTLVVVRSLEMGAKVTLSQELVVSKPYPG